jgi:hypothetical protein
MRVRLLGRIAARTAAIADMDAAGAGLASTNSSTAIGPPGGGVAAFSPPRNPQSATNHIHYHCVIHLMNDSHRYECGQEPEHGDDDAGREPLQSRSTDRWASNTT